MGILNLSHASVMPQKEEAMVLSDENQVRELARLVGITIAEEELAEVTNRFNSLMGELARLSELDLADIQPVSVFPDDYDAAS